MKPIRIEPEAKQELASAAEWYELRREGLGRELLSEVDAVLAAIARDPLRFPPFIDFVSKVRVIAIAHERRRPEYWRGRLP